MIESNFQNLHIFFKKYFRDFPNKTTVFQAEFQIGFEQFHFGRKSCFSVVCELQLFLLRFLSGFGFF